MADKDKIPFYGDNVNGIAGPRCYFIEGTPFVGGYECINCKYCYGITKRVWDGVDNKTGKDWKNSQYDGYVYCSYGNKSFISKIKKHIFNLCSKKLHIKRLSDERR